MDEVVLLLNNNNILEFKDIQKKIDNIVSDMDKLLKTITSINKSKIILIGYYNPYNNYSKELEQVFSYFSDKYLLLSKKYSITYVDIYNLIKKDQTYLPNKLDYHLTSKGYLEIAKEIIEKNEL